MTLSCWLLMHFKADVMLYTMILKEDLEKTKRLVLQQIEGIQQCFSGNSFTFSYRH